MNSKHMFVACGIAGASIFLLAGCAAQTNVSVKNGTVSNIEPNATYNSSKSKNLPRRSVSPPLTSIQMVNQKIGWAIGHRSLWYTTDGAKTWKNVTPKGLKVPPNPQVKIYGVGLKNAWLAAPGNLSVSNRAVIYHTSDAGQSWVKEKIRDKGSPMSLHFRNTSDGSLTLLQGGAAGSEGETVYQTQNGGATWNKVSATNDVKGGSLPFGGDKTGVSFIDNTNGWATGSTAVNGHTYLYRTNNDGRSWNSQKLSVSSKLSSAEFKSYPPIFFGHKDGILPVQWSQGLIAYRTTDGGNKWTATSLVRTKVKNGQMKHWSFPSFNDGFATGATHLFVTMDGGRKWKAIRTNLSVKNIHDLDFTSSKEGWALTNSGSLFHTTDGGHIWKKSN